MGALLDSLYTPLSHSQTKFPGCPGQSQKSYSLKPKLPKIHGGVRQKLSKLVSLRRTLKKGALGIYALTV